jgi:calcineurin-like phosphoesterase family protein
VTQLKINKDTWIVSDTHFGHSNMVKLCNRLLNFNERIVQGWRKTVKENDPILHLGDLVIFFGPLTDMWLDMAATLPGDKYLIRGNHDKKNSYKGFTVVDEQLVEIDDKWIIFSHHPKEKEDWWDLNIHGHLHGNGSNVYPYQKDVGVDVVGYKPVRLGELI